MYPYQRSPVFCKGDITSKQMGILFLLEYVIFPLFSFGVSQTAALNVFNPYTPADLPLQTG